MYDAGSKWNFLTACTPALSRYSNRRSTGDVTSPAASGAPATVYSASFSVAVTASFAVRSVNGSGCAVELALDELQRLPLPIAGSASAASS